LLNFSLLDVGESIDNVLLEAKVGHEVVLGGTVGGVSLKSGVELVLQALLSSVEGRPGVLHVLVFAEVGYEVIHGVSGSVSSLGVGASSGRADGVGLGFDFTVELNETSLVGVSLIVDGLRDHPDTVFVLDGNPFVVKLLLGLGDVVKGALDILVLSEVWDWVVHGRTVGCVTLEYGVELMLKVLLSPVEGVPCVVDVFVSSEVRHEVVHRVSSSVSSLGVGAAGRRADGIGLKLNQRLVRVGFVVSCLGHHPDTVVILLGNPFHVLSLLFSGNACLSSCDIGVLSEVWYGVVHGRSVGSVALEYGVELVLEVLLGPVEGVPGVVDVGVFTEVRHEVIHGVGLGVSSLRVGASGGRAHGVGLSVELDERFVGVRFVVSGLGHHPDAVVVLSRAPFSEFGFRLLNMRLSILNIFIQSEVRYEVILRVSSGLVFLRNWSPFMLKALFSCLGVGKGVGNVGILAEVGHEIILGGFLGLFEVRDPLMCEISFRLSSVS